jgi:hypothetical protein
MPDTMLRLTLASRSFSEGWTHGLHPRRKYFSVFTSSAGFSTCSQ